MTDWATISSLATGAGTLVLAVATFASVRSGNRSARIAERSFALNLRPVLVPSHSDDAPQKVGFIDEQRFLVRGERAAVELRDGAVYMVVGLRNIGPGIGMIQGWGFVADGRQASGLIDSLDGMRAQTRDLWVPPGDTGFWQAAIRDPADPDYDALRSAIESHHNITVDLVYTDHEGSQSWVSRFSLAAIEGQDDRWVSVGRHRPAPSAPPPR